MDYFEEMIKNAIQGPSLRLSSNIYYYSNKINSFTGEENLGISIANIVMVVAWIIGVLWMSVNYVRINTYKEGRASGSDLFKKLYQICHLLISIILLLYVIVKTEHFGNIEVSPQSEPVKPGINNIDDNKKKPTKSITSSSDFAEFLISFIINIPISIREDFKNVISKFNTLDYDGNMYQTQINLGVMFKLVVSHIPIIIFLIVFTSMASMIKAYHKILCGNSNPEVSINWPYRIIDIIMYAIFRIIGLFIIFKNFWNNESPPFLLSIFYFTAVYLIIRFLLLLYENIFSNTIISLFKWDIRESACNSDISKRPANWILDPIERQQVKDEQNNEDSTKLTNDVFSLLFNILLVLFLSGISIISACLLILFSYPSQLKALITLTSEIGHKTMNRKILSGSEGWAVVRDAVNKTAADKAAADKAAADKAAKESAAQGSKSLPSASEFPPSETGRL
jgi:hypothetical protein